jgi:hypothetical protein
MMMVLMVESDRVSKTKIIWQVPKVSVFVDQMILGIHSNDKFLISIKVSPHTFKYMCKMLGMFWYIDYNGISVQWIGYEKQHVNLCCYIWVSSS